MMDKPNNWLKRIDRAIWKPHLAPLPVWKTRVVSLTKREHALFIIIKDDGQEFKPSAATVAAR